MTDLCGCIKCTEARPKDPDDPFGFRGYFRFACEICGNKRCPHHTNHELACTNSNEPGQKGSIWK